MGDYCTTAELTTRFASDLEASYATDNESVGTASSTVLDECIDTAEGEINSYLAMRYATPVDTTLSTAIDNLMLGITLDIAEWHVLNRSPSVSEQKTAQYERRIEWLKMIAKGEANMPGAVTLPSTLSNGTTASWTGSNRTLSDESPRLFSRETASTL